MTPNSVRDAQPGGGGGGDDDGTLIGRETTPLLSESIILPRSTSTQPNDDVVDRQTTSSTRSSSASFRYVSNRIIRSLSSSQRENALRNMGVGPAAFLIKDAVLGYQDAPWYGWYDPYKDPQREVRNFLSVLCGRLVAYKITNRLLIAANWVLFVLSFMEPPQWCRDSDLDIAQYNKNDSLREFGDCRIILNAKGTAADGTLDVELYPNFGAMWLSAKQSQAIDLVCVAIIATFGLFELGKDGFELHLYFYPGLKRWLHVSRITLLILLGVGLAAQNVAFSPFFRMLLLATHLRDFQSQVLSLIKMLPQVLYILFVLFIIIIFYGWIGVVLFFGTDQGAAGFPNLLEGVWTLWICVTTANYPDVMMPSYNNNRLSALFFVTFMIVSFFYLMNLVLAAVVNAYDENFNERKQSRKELSRELLTRAFEVMDQNKTGRIGRESIMALFLILNEDYPDIRTLSEEETLIVFGFLDKDGSSTITKEEFLEFGDVLLLEFTKQSDYATFVEVRLPRIYNTKWYQGLCRVIRSAAFEYVTDFVLLLNAIIIAIQSYPQLSGRDVTMDPHYSDGYIDTEWELMETIFTGVYVVEAALKILVNGWKKYSESSRNVFDFTITVLAVLASAYVYYPNAYSDSHLIRFVVMARVLRLGRLLMAFNAFALIGTVSIEIIPAATHVILMLLFLMYGFAALGTLLYGGMITRDPQNPLSTILLEASDFVDNGYWANNFNDLFSGMNVLFNLLVVNNWTQCEIGFEYVTGAKWVRLFFFAFHILGVVLINNVVIAFIINAFFQQLKLLNDRQGWEERVQGEALIKGDKGMFDASTITGTDTGASGKYIARIRPRPMDVDVNERAALRHLFTQTSSIG